MGHPVLCPVDLMGPERRPVYIYYLFYRSGFCMDHTQSSVRACPGVAMANVRRYVFALLRKSSTMKYLVYSVRECLMGRPVLWDVEGLVVYHPIAGVVPGTAYKALNLFMK